MSAPRPVTVFMPRTVTELATLAGVESVEYVASAAGVESGALAFLDTVEGGVGRVYVARRRAYPGELDLDSALAVLASNEVSRVVAEAVPSDARERRFVVEALVPDAALEAMLHVTGVEADRVALNDLGLRLARGLLAAHVGAPASRTYEVTYSVEVPFGVTDLEVEAAARSLLARGGASYVGHTLVDED